MPDALMTGRRALGDWLGRRFNHLPLLWQMGLVLPALLSLVGVLAGLGLLLAQEGSQMMAKGRLDAAEIVAAELNHELDESFDTLEWTARRAEPAFANAEASRVLLADILHPSRESIVRVFLVAADGRLVDSAPGGWYAPGTDLASHAYVQMPLTTGLRYASGVSRDEETRRPIVALSVPVLAADGRLLGVMGLALDPEASLLTTLVTAAQQLGETGHAELVDQDSRLIASSEPGHILRPAEHPTFYAQFNKRHAHGVGVTDPIGDEDPEDRGQRHVMAYVPLDMAPWGVALGGSESAFTALADRWGWESLPFGVLALMIAVYLIWVTRRSVVEPVRALTRISESIAGGNLTTPVPLLGDGEVRVLAERFDAMRSHLQLALDALAQEKSRYQGIIESMAEAVICTDTEHRITSFNHAAEVITGWPVDEVLGRRYSDVHLLASDGDVRGSDCLEGVQANAVTREVLRRRKGDELTVSISRSSIHGESGSDRGTLYVMRDATAEAEVDRLKDQFLSTVSHELRSPLGCIKGFASTLLLPSGSWDADTTERCLREVVNASDELEDLVDNLLDMSKISAGVFTIQPREVDFAGLVAAVLQRSAPRAGGHSLRVDLPRRPATIFADARRVEQVLHNLVDNAVKYSPRGGRITISARHVVDKLQVSVTDEGMGIPAEDLPGLFQRFHRGANPEVQSISGCGLGLAICRGIVESHGGRVWITSPVALDSRSAPGTAVMFTLPLYVAESGRRQHPRLMPLAEPWRMSS